MGQTQSHGTLREEQVITPTEPSRGTSVEFSPSLISRLSSPASSTSSSSSPSAKNAQGSTDEIIRKRLAAESANLRAQEAEILRSISAALEKENLDKEKPGMSSEVLGRDIEEVREKVERMKREREGKEGEGVRKAKEGVVRCYREKSDRPLDCWKEVEQFKSEVAKLEQAFVKSIA